MGATSFITVFMNNLRINLLAPRLWLPPMRTADAAACASAQSHKPHYVYSHRRLCSIFHTSMDTIHRSTKPTTLLLYTQSQWRYMTLYLHSHKPTRLNCCINSAGQQCCRQYLCGLQQTQQVTKTDTPICQMLHPTPVHRTAHQVQALATSAHLRLFLIASCHPTEKLEQTGWHRIKRAK